MGNYTPLFHNTLFQSPPLLFHPPLHNFIRNDIMYNTSSRPVEKKKNKLTVVYLSRKRLLLLLNLSISTLLVGTSSSIIIAAEQEQEQEQDQDQDQDQDQEQEELSRYTDSLLGFTFLRPSSYIKVEKAGATVLFEEPNKGGANNVGVVVTPVRLTNLADFGTPQFVAHKLIQAEKRKESTKEADVIAVSERSGRGGLQVYEFEYKVDSSRGGIKRIFSAAFVASRKLYLLNIAHTDKPESPLDTHTRQILEHVLHSFDTAPLT